MCVGMCVCVCVCLFSRPPRKDRTKVVWKVDIVMKSCSQKELLCSAQDHGLTGSRERLERRGCICWGKECSGGGGGWGWGDRLKWKYSKPSACMM